MAKTVPRYLSNVRNEKILSLPRDKAFRRGFTPESISGLVLWLDLSDTASVTLDGNGLISNITDKSGNGFDGSQTTAVNRPGVSTLNGRQCGNWGTTSNKELPPQYQSTKQFETLMSLPVGKEWNTGDSYRRLIQPDLLTKAGSVIKPLRFKSDIKVETIEKLVAHREKKKAQRSTAKF